MSQSKHSVKILTPNEYRLISEAKTMTSRRKKLPLQLCLIETRMPRHLDQEHEWNNKFLILSQQEGLSVQIGLDTIEAIGRKNTTKMILFDIKGFQSGLI